MQNNQFSFCAAFPEHDGSLSLSIWLSHPSPEQNIFSNMLHSRLFVQHVSVTPKKEARIRENFQHGVTHIKKEQTQPNENCRQ
jgi:hypothetical protein